MILLGYVIEYLKKGESKWVKGGEVHGDTRKGKVTKLEEGQQYQFRVKAVNKAGPGEPSEPTLSHTARARFGEPISSRYLLIFNF